MINENVFQIRRDIFIDVYMVENNFGKLKDRD